MLFMSKGAKPLLTLVRGTPRNAYRVGQDPVRGIRDVALVVPDGFDCYTDRV